MFLVLAIGLLNPSFTYDGEVQNLPTHVAEITKLKTCNNKLVEQIVQFVKDKYPEDQQLHENILRSISSTCISKDELIAIALGIGMDPAIIMVALDAASSSGGNQPIVTAPVPGSTGPGGGTGSGDSSLASGN